MQLYLAQIKEEGASLEQTLERAWLQDVLLGGKSARFDVCSPLRIIVFTQRLGRDILIRSAFHLPLSVECSLCLEEFDLEIPVDFALTLKPKNDAEAEPPQELELSVEDLEELSYQGERIDLGEILREQIILALPMYPKCSEDCRGLCPVCGINLNQESCGCEREDVDPRWIQLKILSRH